MKGEGVKAFQQVENAWGSRPTQYMPKTTAMALGYLVEECGEVLAAAGKTLRWGPESTNPELPLSEQETNRAWLKRELADLELAIALTRKALR